MVTEASRDADDDDVWVWIAAALVAWTAIALFLAVVLGRGIALADRRTGPASLFKVAAERTTSAVVSARRQVPLPPVGIALAFGVVVLEAIGYALRLRQVTGEAARLLSMDAPYSLPRLYIAALFGAAAVAAAAAAGRIPGRRTWWLAVGVVAGGIAVVKAGSTIHVRAMNDLTDAVGAVTATALSVLAAAAVVAVLGFLSRTERRDRRRVLSFLALYGAASVGLSAVSTALAVPFGRASTWYIASTFVEEAGEGLTAVAFLVAVMIGVAPRLVLPASWVLRRQADAQTLDVPAPRGEVIGG